jgi:hypothetical protein
MTGGMGMGKLVYSKHGALHKLVDMAIEGCLTLNEPSTVIRGGMLVADADTSRLVTVNWPQLSEALFAAAQVRVRSYLLSPDNANLLESDAMKQLRRLASEEFNGNRKCSICALTLHENPDDSASTSAREYVYLPCCHIFHKYCYGQNQRHAAARQDSDDGGGGSGKRSGSKLMCPECRTRFTAPISAQAIGRAIFAPIEGSPAKEARRLGRVKALREAVLGDVRARYSEFFL